MNQSEIMDSETKERAIKYPWQNRQEVTDEEHLGQVFAVNDFVTPKPHAGSPDLGQAQTDNRGHLV